jgi:hypothetical protein
VEGGGQRRQGQVEHGQVQADDEDAEGERGERPPLATFRCLHVTVAIFGSGIGLVESLK